MSITVYHEMPLFALEDGTEEEYTDGSYALVHLFENEFFGHRYFDHFVKMLEKGRPVILDNSIFELGESFDSETFNYWLCRLVDRAGTDATLTYIVPDVLDDSRATVESFDRFMEAYPDTPGTPMAVVQGSTPGELNECHDALLKRVSYIGVSFNSAGYNDLLHSAEQTLLTQPQQYALGRYIYVANNLIDFLEQSYNETGHKTNVTYHLLGAGVPQEFKLYAPYHRQYIASLDTSNPVVHGILGIAYEEGFGLAYKQTQLLADWMGFDTSTVPPSRIRLMKENMRAFREINNL